VARVPGLFAVAAAVLLGSHSIVDAFALPQAVPPAAQNNPACSPNPLPVGVGANSRPHVYRGPDKFSTPTRIVYVRPAYPESARTAKVQDVVVLEAQIERDGRVCSTRVVRSIPLLDQAAIDAVLRWRFTPARANDVAVPVITTLTVNFTLP
jgi:protein TonB